MCPRLITDAKDGPEKVHMPAKMVGLTGGQMKEIAAKEWSREIKFGRMHQLLQGQAAVHHVVHSQAPELQCRQTKRELLGNDNSSSVKAKKSRKRKKNQKLEEEGQLKTCLEVIDAKEKESKIQKS